MIDEDRVQDVADAIAALNYDGIVKFDGEEPEYSTFKHLYEEFDDFPHLALLGICAGTADYQLAGDAQRYWAELEDIALKHGQLSSTMDVKQILGTFMEAPVNSRLNQQKRTRLVKLFDGGFADWFIENHDSAEPIEVWGHVADGLDNPMRRKTIVFSMKVYDIIHLIVEGEYLDFPKDIPIPCDLQVERIARTAGLVDTEDEEVVMSAWAQVMEEVTDALGRDVSLLRIDSIVWQAGQIVGKHEPNRESAKAALTEHFEKVGLERGHAEELARQLTLFL